MDTFDKLYKQSKVNRSSSPNNTSKWFKNATRSIGHSAFDVVKSFVPATMDTTVSMKDIQKDLRESFVDTKKVGVLKTGSLVALGKELWNNSLDDLKSGNFHNQGRIDAAEAKSMGFGEDFDLDFGEFDFGDSDNDFNFDMSSNDGKSAVQMKRKSGNNNEVTQINIETNLGKDSAIVQATERHTEISVKTAQQLAEVSNNNTKIMMSHISKLGKTLSGQLATINDNISIVSTIVSESMTSHFTVANKYYEDSLDLFTEMNKTLVSMHDMMKSTHSPSSPTERDVRDYNSVLDIFTSNGGLNTRAYKDLVKKQFKGYIDSSMLGQVLSMGKMAGQFGMMDELKSSPISTMITAGMKAIVPKAVKGALADFDSQLKESLATGLFQINGLKRSQNPLLQAIGNIFGIKNTKYNVDKGNYNKGPMAWNGIAHRTLVDVIPTYLSQIAAAVTGTEQRVFDYKEGKYVSLSSIREDHTRRDREEQLSPYSEIRSSFNEFLDEFKFNSREHKQDYTDKFDKYLLDIVKSSGNMNFNNTRQLTNSVGDETVAKMIQQFMRTNSNRSMITAAYGRNALEAIENISTRNKRIEEDPTKYNHQYIDNGMTTISGKNGGILGGRKVDSYNHDDLFYLRGILQTLNTAVPVRIIKGGKGFNQRMLAGMGSSSMLSGGTSESNTQQQSSSSFSTGSMFGSAGISLEDAVNMTPDQLQEAINNQHPSSQTQSPSLFLKLLKSFGVKEDSNTYKFAKNVHTKISNATGGAESTINKATNTLFTLLFGDGDERGIKGAINLVLGGVKRQMGKFASFIDDKVIGPLNESLFGDEGIFTRISKSEKFAKLKEKFNGVKTSALNFIFGEKGTDGKRKNGIFSDTLNSLSDMGTSAKDFILHDEDGVVSNMKSMFKDLTGSIKTAVGIEENKNKPKTSFSDKVSTGASDFLSHIKERGSEWTDLIFGETRDKQGQKIQTELSKGFGVLKSDMKGKKGKLGASATVGLLSSFFLPGGPIGGALLGLGAGIISESSQLKDFLFGKLGNDGKRGNNGIISQDVQNFFKDHKTGVSVGAFAGIASSVGLLPAFFAPGGPIGGALLGGAVSLVAKSGAFNDLIYGEGGTKDKITGGITKFIQDHYKKDANVKSTFMDAGLGAGVGILGSFFLPGGPITGALLGSAANIAINTDKFKTLMFGDEELDDKGNKTGRRKGGLFGKFTNYIGDKVLLPLQKSAKTTQVKMLEWIETNMTNQLKVAMKPFHLAGKNFMDGVKDTVNDLKESFKTTVTKPLGDAVEKHILDPMKKAFGKIFGGLGRIVGSIISAPFKMLQGAASSLNKSQVKAGQSDYDMTAEAEKLNKNTTRKYRRKMIETRSANLKQKHWINPLSSTPEDIILQQNIPGSSDYSDDTRISDANSAYTQEEQDEIYGALAEQAQDQYEEYKKSKTSSKTKTKIKRPANTSGGGAGRKTGTSPSMPLNLQFFAESAKSDKMGFKDFVREVLMSIDENIESIRNHFDSSDETRISTADTSESSVISNVSPIESYVKTIANSVDGQLNGVGYNVNKILRVLLKKNGITEDEVAGENNKKYSRGGRIKGLLMTPFKLLRSGVAGIVESAKGVVSDTLSGVTTAIKGLLSIPKTIVSAGKTVLKGIGHTALSLVEGAGTAIKTGLNAVGDAIYGAARGFGEMIGNASAGFGEMIGGALGGFGNLLNGLGLIGKELGPVIAKGIGTLIGAPFKFAGAAGSFISDIFGKGKGGTRGSRGKSSHVVVDEYLGEDRIIHALNAIEFAVLHGKPMDGEGPKYKGSQIIDVDEERRTQLALPSFLQFFTNSSAGGSNGLPNVLRASNDQEERMELATRVAQGSASEMNERFKAQDEQKEERSFRERLLAKFTESNKEQKRQGLDWSSIFSKKGLITGALIAAVPLVIKYLPKLVDFIKNIWDKFGNIADKVGDWLGDTAGNVLNNATSQGGVTGILNGAGEQLKSATDLIGLTEREEYAIGENGEILTDEDGNPIKVSQGKEGVGTRISEFYTPTVTKIDHDTGEAYQTKQYDSTTRGKLHVTRRVAKSAYKGASKAYSKGKTVGTTISNGASKVGKWVQSGSDYNKLIANGYENLAKSSSISQKAAGKVAKVVDPAKTATKAASTKVKTVASNSVDTVIKYGKQAFDMLITKFSDFITKYAPKAGSKVSKITSFITKGFKKVFNVKTVTKFMPKFTKILGKIATAAATVLTSEIFWGVTGAIEGATNAAYTFEVSEDAVDGKMRAIASIFRALLSTSIGAFVDVADSIIYEITGTSFVNELAVLAYNLVSDSDDEKALKQARESFNESYNKYVEEEYEAYKQNQEANGQTAMSMDEFKSSDLVTSKQVYNSEQNQSFVKKAWDGVTGFGRNVGKTAAKGWTAVKNSKVGQAVSGLGTRIKESYDGSKLKTLVDGVSNIGSAIISGTMGMIKHAWTGDDGDLISLPSESDDPTVKIKKVALIGSRVLLAPIISTIKSVRSIYDFANQISGGVKSVGSTIKTSVSGRISAAWNGEDYDTAAASENNPLGKIGNIVDIASGVLISPITSTIRTGRQLADFANQVWGGVKSVGSTIKTSVSGRISAAWNGEDYEVTEASDSPLGNWGTALDMATGVMLSPITLTVKGISNVVKHLKPLFGAIDDFGSDISSYSDVFGRKTTISNYWTQPGKEDNTGLGPLKTIMFYMIRGALAIPFYLTSAVKTIKEKVGDAVSGIVDKIIAFFGDGEAFNVEESGGSGGFGGGSSARSSKTSLNGFTYYSQNDTRIKDQEYNQTDGTPGTMGERGCGPTALSMVASELTGKNYDPISMAKMAESEGFSTDVGTTTGYFGSVGSQLGMGVSGGRANPDAITNSLRNGNPVILQGSGGAGSPYTSQGHYVVGVGMKDGNVLVNDPRGPEYSKAYSMDKIMNGAAGMWSFSGGKGPANGGASSLIAAASSMANNVGTTVSNESSSVKAEQALVNAMYSIKDKVKYSRTDRDRVGDALNGTGSGDCSSTVRWAYQQAVGVDPGSYTGAQITDSDGVNVDAYNNGPPTEANLRPGDLLFYTKSGRGTHAQGDVGHVEMYVGNGKLMGHGGGSNGTVPGPTEKDMASYRVNDYIGARRFIGNGTNVVNSFDGTGSSPAASAASSMANSASSSLSGKSSSPTSISDLISGAISAVSTGINNFFGLNSSSSSSSASSTSGTSTSTTTSTGSSSVTAANLTAGDEQQQIWNYFRQQGLTKEGTAGLMGNLQHESGNHAVRLQGDMKAPYQKSQEYTANVDNGSYSNFVNDSKGYGLAQWTFSSRKKGLLDAAKANGKSVGDLGVQLGYLNHELNTKYGGVLNVLKTATDIKTASNAVLHDFERPADKSIPVENERASYGQSYYNQFANNETGGFGSKSPRISHYQSKYKSRLGGFGANDGTRQSMQQQVVSVPRTNYISAGKSMKPADMVNKLFEYLGKIVSYMESTSSGIAKLNQKDFGGTQLVNQPSYTNVNGGNVIPTQTPGTPDTSNYDLGRLIAQGQLT